MGDRANVFVKENADGTGIYLYTHWSGYRLPETLRSALDRGRGRWGDTSYLARIIFSEMIEGQEQEETGYGISTRLGDNEYPILVVDEPARKVRVAPEGRERAGPYITEWGYEEFVKLDLTSEGDAWGVLEYGPSVRTTDGPDSVGIAFE